MFDLAEHKIEIVSYHWGLQRGSGTGQKVFDSLARAVKGRKVSVSIIHTSNKTEDERYDTVDLLKMAPDLVSVRSISMPTLIKGSINQLDLHTLNQVLLQNMLYNFCLNACMF